ncbi:MAG: HYR domain-containing protein [Algibacter sp.]
MKKLYTIIAFKNKYSMNLSLFIALTILSITYSYGQVTFNPRTSTVPSNGAKEVYRLKGDFTMIGNANLKIAGYDDNDSGDRGSTNDTDMEYIDIDTDPTTLNSSSATLTFSTENGAKESCSKVIYAGLYWMGRAHNGSDDNDDGDNNHNTFEVSKGGLTKTLDKRIVYLKGPNQTTYQTISSVTTNEINFPDNNTNRNIFVGYAEITDYLNDVVLPDNNDTTLGEYFVSDIATSEGHEDVTGFSGGWGMVVVYENSEMNWRDVTVFDGYAYMDSNGDDNTISASGFQSVDNGPVNLKLGIMASEGERGWNGDFFEIEKRNSGDYQPLKHSNNETNNFFSSNILTNGARTPNYYNNSGVDILMFNIDNGSTDPNDPDYNEIIGNVQTSTTFRYGTNRDSYAIFNVTFSVDAYVPEPEGILTTTSVNGNTNPPELEVIPGGSATYKIEIKNTGTESINNTTIILPIPISVDASSLTVNSNVYAPLTTTSIPEYRTGIDIVTGVDYGPNGSIVWDLGVLPQPPTSDPEQILADISFTLTATKDCDILKSISFSSDPTISLNGTISGTGATSGTDFTTDLIKGYIDSGDCIGTPIPTPNTVDVIYQDYINESPTGTPPSPETIECGATIPPADITSVTNLADNSGITPTVLHVSDVSDNGDPEIITRTYSITDDCGNVTNVTQLFTINNTTPPEITCPNDINQNVDTGVCGATVTFTPPVGTDNCPGATTAQTAGLASGATFPVGTTTNTFEVTDAAGLKTSCSFDVIITDNEAPAITCPNNVTVNVDLANCSSTSVDLGLPTASDNCGIDTIENDAPTIFPLGDTTVTWTVTDTAGLTNSCLQTVTVIDNIDPSITCPIDVFATADTGLCTASNVDLGTPTTSDCVVSTVDNNAPPIFPLGETTVTWTVTDGSGNTASCTQKVTITDDELPTISCPADVTANTSDDAIGNCSTTVALGTPTADDNCSVDTIITQVNNITINPATFEFGLGETTVTWIVTDGSGNTASCTQKVTITDDELPTISCPADVTANTSDDAIGNCLTTVALGSPTADDNCSVDTIIAQINGITITPATFEFGLGETTVTWIVTDGSGNTASCTQKVTITDDELPTISCPADVTANTSDDAIGNCSTTVALGSPTTDDNCSVDTVVAQINGIAITPATFEFAIGESTVTWIVTDGSGNTASCTQKVTITDDELPTITCPNNVTVNVDVADCSSSTVDLGLPTALDNCTIDTVVNNAPTTFPIGDTTVIWTVTDEAGNSASCTQTVTVIDNIDPSITCPIDVFVTADPGICTASNVDLGTPTTSDCDDSTVKNDALTIFQLGETIVTWTVTDSSGNIATCEQIVTVTDDELPTITCPDTISVTADAGSCSATNVDLGESTIADNCSGVSVTNNAVEPFALGDTTITWTVTDGSGNIATCEQIVTVTDDELPTITCPDTISVTADAGSCSATNVDLGEPTIADNCSGVSATNNAVEPFAIGDTTVTWTVTDGSGNIATCEQIVTVTDDELPTITCPDTISVTADAGSCSATNVDLGEPTIADNCSGVSATNDAIEPFALGDTTVTWTVTDGSGNIATCEQIVTVTDDELPTITCPDNITVIADAGLCSATNVDLGEPITADNCSVEPATNNALEPFALGDTTVTWTVTDGSGNIATCEQIVTVIDGALPIITCPSDVTVSVDTNTCGATNVSLGDLDVEDCTSVTVTNNAPTTFEIGNTTVIWTAIDAAGNETTCEQIVTVIDNISPEFVETLPVNDTVECDSIPDAETLTATDNCGTVNVTYEEVKTDGSCESNYTLERTWTATDSSNLSTVYTQTITVTDTTAPEFEGSLPSNVTVECDNIPDAETLTATDNCNTATVEVVDVKIDGVCDSSYIIERTYTATDACGLQTAHTQRITVQDNTAPEPTTTFETSITVSCTDIPEIPALEFADNCSSNVSLEFNETNSFDENTPTDYEIVRTWTVKDDCGNEKDHVQTLTVILDEVVTEVSAPERCFDDGVIDLNEFLSVENLNGVWEMLEGDTDAILTNNIFNPTTLELAEDFLPFEHEKEYLFRYTTTNNGCISVTEVSLPIIPDCVVLPCGQNDIEISKALTPNGDGVNETFDIKGIDLCGFTADVKIFNRWGALIYEDSTYALGEQPGRWDGSAHKSSFGGSNTVPNGVYYYIIVLKNSGLEPITGPLYLGTK